MNLKVRVKKLERQIAGRLPEDWLETEHQARETLDRWLQTLPLEELRQWAWGDDQSGDEDFPHEAA